MKLSTETGERLLTGVLAAGLGLSIAVVATPTPEQTETIGCVVRFYEDGPALHQNGSHPCLGATGVWVHQNGSLVVDHDRCAPVVSASVLADETLGPRGIYGGVSGGVCDSHIIFTNMRTGAKLDLNKPVDYAQLVGAYSNAWWSVERLTTGTE